MRPAVAIGCALDGERGPMHEGRTPVEWAEVTLRADWRADATALRGAVVGVLGRGCHVDYHGHTDEGRGRQARAVVLYRCWPPRVWCYGPRALDHAAELAGIRALRYAGGTTIEVDEAVVRSGVAHVGVSQRRWHRYEFVSPYEAPGAKAHRAPADGPERRAWLGQAIADSIRLWLADVGVEALPHVQVESPTRWVSNVDLPDGVGLGAGVAYGAGEVRRC